MRRSTPIFYGHRAKLTAAALGHSLRSYPNRLGLNEKTDMSGGGARRDHAGRVRRRWSEQDRAWGTGGRTRPPGPAR